MKKLFSFKVKTQEEVNVEEPSKNEKGEEIVIKRKEKKTVEKDFFIRKPNRSLHEEAELFYGVTYSQGIQAGLLPRALLIKRFSNDGGVLSELEQNKFVSLYESLFKKQNEFQRLNIKPEDQRTNEEKESYQTLLKEISTLQVEVEDFELQQQTLFNQTPEYRARNKTIFWWILNLSYKLNEKNEEVPIFGEGNFAEKVKKYDEISESENPADDFIKEAVQRFYLFISFWYTGKATVESDFKNLEGLINNPPAQKTEEKPKEETESK